ncbi:MAG: hypothetical protein J1E34_03545 [Oscillospiraceae bacterium]|nr:hypothetical protein [Oscillospiraceae bacterium]
MFPVFDDSDMKIVGEKSHIYEENSDFQRYLDESSKQHFNGNASKAKAIGSNIVSSFSYRAAPAELVQFVIEQGVKPTDSIMLQVRFLSVFSAEYCLGVFLPSPFLSDIAKSAMYDVLMEYSPDFYDLLARSGAFSFYYLALRDSENIGRAVGKQFAVLCGEKNNEKYASLGEKLHELSVSVYKKAINGFAFV